MGGLVNSLAGDDESAASADGSPPALARRYVGAPGAQVHLLEGGRGQTGRPLYCLHATAYSGRSLAPLLQALAPRRPVAAADTPGYGGSDPPARRGDLESYARALDTALDAAGEGEVDLFGYHTGALLAAELARLRPDRVKRLVLIGVPYMTGREQAVWRARLAAEHALTPDLDQFRERWTFLVTDRPWGMSLERGFDNFVDELRAYPRGWWAHDAAFTFDVESCFAAVSQPTLVLNPDNHLSAASRQAAAALAQGRVVELPHLSNGIFDVAPLELADLIEGFLHEERRGA